MFLATDKIAHMGVCYIITMIIWAILQPWEWAILVGAAVAFAIGLAKEIYDMKTQHIIFNVGDLWADCAGFMLAYITYGIYTI